MPRRYAMGAEIVPGEGVHFRLWAPRRSRVEVVLEDGPATPLRREDGGWFSELVAGIGAGARYRYRLDGEPRAIPDPASRFQPAGPHGASEVVDGRAYAWQNAFGGRPLRGQVLYELHVGTFSPEGTWAGAAARLPDLADLGVTVLEVMPVADFPGRFGWGYDGVNLWAPTRLYGRPDDFRAFVDRAHGLGLAVILDVVYNHLGPRGNYLRALSDDWFTDKYDNEWGEAIHFEGPRPVRELFVENAAYWIDEFRLDGLRLDATQCIFDASPENVMAELARRVREAARGRETILVAENEPQEARLVRPPPHGFGLDGLWNDDFHHTARVALTGRREAYYLDYTGSPQELVSALKWGYLFQGQRYEWQKKPRGAPALDLPSWRMVTYLDNHDQVANSARGQRASELGADALYRALTGLWLLGPNTPMLFQGQEFAATTPFLYFADHEPDLAPLVRRGRAELLAQFPSIANAEAREALDDPGDPATFEKSRLDWRQRDSEKGRAAIALHRDLLRLRREDALLSRHDASRMHGAVLSPTALLLRYFGDRGDDRLVLTNLGRDLDLAPAPEPLLAPPEGRRWELVWSSERPAYGGWGVRSVLDADGRLFLAGQSTLFLAAGRGGSG